MAPYFVTWNNLGNAYSNLGQTTQAIAAYHEALRIDPTYSKAWINLGAAYDDLGQPAQATEAYQQALRLDALAWYALGVAYYHTGQKGLTTDIYTRLKGLDADIAEAFFKAMSALTVETGFSPVRG